MAGLQQPSIHFVTIKVQLLLLFVLDSTSLVDIPALHGVSDISSLMFSLFFFFVVVICYLLLFVCLFVCLFVRLKAQIQKRPILKSWSKQVRLRNLFRVSMSIFNSV